MNHEESKLLLKNWYEEYCDDIFQYIYFMISDYNEAKDLTQDTFIKAYEKMSSFDGRNPKAWLFRIARNMTIDMIRRNKKIMLFQHLISARAKSAESPENQFLFTESEREIIQVLQSLKRNYRDVIVLRKIKELSTKETANILGWSESKVKSNLIRGLKAFKTEWEKEGYSNGFISEL
ncbi:RNA polymerase sigma factor [Alkalihalobacterium bogoriense]|uniref:RNA polymerase sigma factor n=1 Tax=Alkalihalobacterium bogoriense TaxID=246272 RepID=UPI00047B1977|nr:sigma-70 family RNA polymerase sigma factor [Alkalihalobacterium bogoriense]